MVWKISKSTGKWLIDAVSGAWKQCDCCVSACSSVYIFRNCSIEYDEDCTVSSGDDVFVMCADDTHGGTPIEDVFSALGAGDKKTVFWTGGAYGPSCYYPDPDPIPKSLADAMGLTLVDADDASLTYQTESCSDSPCVVGAAHDPCDCVCKSGNATLGTYCCWGVRDGPGGDATFTFNYARSGYYYLSHAGGPGTGVAPCEDDCNDSKGCVAEQWEYRITGGFTATDCEVCTTRQRRTIKRLDPLCCSGDDVADGAWGSDETYCLSPQRFTPAGDCDSVTVVVRFYSYGGFANTTTTTVTCSAESCTLYERTEIVTDRTAINGDDDGPTCIQEATSYETERIEIITGVDPTGTSGGVCAACRTKLLASGV